MAKIIHSMIRVKDLQPSLTFYKQALDLDIAEQLDFDGFSLVYLRNEENDMELELTWNEAQKSLIHTVLAMAILLLLSRILKLNITS